MSVSGGGSKQSASESGQTAPWAPQQPFLMQGFQAASNELANGPKQFYPGQTFTGPSATTTQGMQQMAATAGSSTLPKTAADQVGATASGSYLKDPSAWASQLATSPTMNPNAGARAGVASNPNAQVYNPNANAIADVAPNAQANVTNPNANVANPNANVINSNRSAINPYAGVTSELATNEYLNQDQNAYIDQLTNTIQRTVAPRVQSSYGMAGRSGTSAGAQGAMAKGIADALAPYAFGSAEAEMGRRFAGGESEAARLQGIREALAQRLYGAGGEQAGREYASGESLAGRQFTAGEGQAGRQFTAGEGLAGRQFGAGESLAQGLRDASADQAARKYSAGESYAGRTFTAGETQAQRAQAEAEAAAQRQFAAGSQYSDQAFTGSENAAGRGLSAYEAERQRQLAASGMAPAIDAAQYSGAERLLGVGGMEEQYAQQPIDEAMARWDFEQGAPADEIAKYMDLIQGNYGSVFSGKSSGYGQQAGFNTGNPFSGGK